MGYVSLLLLRTTLEATLIFRARLRETGNASILLTA
jgi:hypothetical protein